ncbi:hypothetical protein HA402_002717 [Bradysia odoriphaga]|nr:hypothetical protein HA402_002717 [Bradysia odoriphaga]
MKFVIETLTKCSPRLGYLQKNDIVLNSPLLLHHTKCAIIPFLSKEVFSYVTTETQAYSICLDSTIQMNDALSEYRKGIASFSGIGSDGITVLTIRNPSEAYKAADVGDQKDSLSIFTRTGRKTISADQYMDLVASHRPDIFHALCDGDTNAQSSNRRTIKSAERTKKFFQHCLERYRTSETLKGQSLFVAPIEGGFSSKHREEFIKEMLVHNADIDGYFLDGFHSNGITATSLQIDSIQDIVQKCNELLPADKFKVMFGPYNPVLMLQLIQLGVDVFDSSYCYLATTHKCALTFGFDLDVKAENRDFDMDLSDPSYKEDFSPILQGCKCLSCQKHTRAYIHHLINTKELLSSILLMIHNTHQYMEFFKTIRQAAANGKIPILIDVVQTQYEKRCLLNENLQKQIENENQLKHIESEKGKKKVKKSVASNETKQM